MWKPTRANRILMVVEALLLVALLWVLAINRTDWIIRFGIRQADLLILLCRIGWAVLAVGLNLLLLVPRLRARRQCTLDAARINFAPDRALDPEELRAELTRFQAERPQLKEMLQQGLDQLDNIARKKQKMAELLERNDVTLLGQASAALADAEQTLCRKLALVLNRALLCDPKEENARRREAVYTEHARTMQVFLNENEDVLNRCETLLTETVRYVEEKKAGREGIDLQVMTDVIRSLANDGIRIPNP